MGNDRGGARRSGDARPATSPRRGGFLGATGAGPRRRTAGDSARADPGLSIARDRFRTSLGVARRDGELGDRGELTEGISGAGPYRSVRDRVRSVAGEDGEGAGCAPGANPLRDARRARPAGMVLAIVRNRTAWPGGAPRGIPSPTPLAGPGRAPNNTRNTCRRPPAGPARSRRSPAHWADTAGSRPGRTRGQPRIIRHADTRAVAGAAVFPLQALEVTLEPVGTEDALARHHRPALAGRGACRAHRAA